MWFFYSLGIFPSYSSILKPFLEIVLYANTELVLKDHVKSILNRFVLAKQMPS